jgi:hypothetical protein
MANEHVKSVRNSMFSQTGDLFKMTQFKKVKSRVGAHHVNSATRKTTFSAMQPAVKKL